jgi:hypothetical protein
MLVENEKRRFIRIELELFGHFWMTISINPDPVIFFVSIIIHKFSEMFMIDSEFGWILGRKKSNHTG